MVSPPAEPAAPPPPSIDPLHPLHPLLAARPGPVAFDPSAEVVSQELAALLEAARWAPSSRNTQPWRFVVGRRGDDTHQQILATLAPADRPWAGRAPLLVVGAHLTRSETGGQLPHGAYDLGQAVAHLTLQATSLGLYVHQITDLDSGALHARLGLPEHTHPKVVIAVGRAGEATSLPADDGNGPPVRHHVATLLLG